MKYFILRFPSGEAVGRWDLTAPLGRVPAGFAHTVSTRAKAEQLQAHFPDTTIVQRDTNTREDNS